MSVKQQSKHELAEALRARYLKASRKEKGGLLDEFVATTGYHRKWACRLLRHGPPEAKGKGGGRPRKYSSVVIGALRRVVELSGLMCGKRLAPFLRELVAALEEEGALKLEHAVREQLIGMSAATIDRRLRLFKLQKRPSGYTTTKPGSLLKQQIPVHTYTPWEEQRPGFVEIDLVAHCATSTAGHYLNTLNVVDVATGWVELIGVWGKGQAGVFAALEQVRERLPFPLLGIDSDNGSESLNDHLLRYCRAEQISFTRSRPYWKNDQAHVEQKHWSVVRKLIGYDRYESQPALDQLNRVYELLRLWVNHWQPLLKLVGKERNGGKLTRRYDIAKTPYRRVMVAGVLSQDALVVLEQEHACWGPASLRRHVEVEIEALWTLRERPTPPTQAVRNVAS